MANDYYSCSQEEEKIKLVKGVAHGIVQAGGIHSGKKLGALL